MCAVEGRDHLRGGGARGVTAALVIDHVRGGETIGWREVGEQFRAKRGLDRRGDEALAWVEPHDPGGGPAAEATVQVVENDHAFPRRLRAGTPAL